MDFKGRDLPAYPFEHEDLHRARRAVQQRGDYLRDPQRAQSAAGLHIVKIRYAAGGPSAGLRGWAALRARVLLGYRIEHLNEERRGYSNRSFYLRVRVKNLHIARMQHRNFRFALVHVDTHVPTRQ